MKLDCMFIDPAQSAQEAHLAEVFLIEQNFFVSHPKELSISFFLCFRLFFELLVQEALLGVVLLSFDCSRIDWSD